MCDRDINHISTSGAAAALRGGSRMCIHKHTHRDKICVGTSIRQRRLRVFVSIISSVGWLLFTLSYSLPLYDIKQAFVCELKFAMIFDLKCKTFKLILGYLFLLSFLDRFFEWHLIWLGKRKSKGESYFDSHFSKLIRLKKAQSLI